MTTPNTNPPNACSGKRSPSAWPRPRTAPRRTSGWRSSTAPPAASTDCEAEFRAARQADPSFALDRAEAGHPVWGPVYRKRRAALTARPRRRSMTAARHAGAPTTPRVSLAGARLLGRHRRRRHRLLRQLPEVLRARPHRMAAQPRLRAGARCARGAASCFVVTDTSLRYRAPARLDDVLEVTVAASRHVGQASLTDGAAGAARPARLLAEGTIRIGCVDARNFPAAPHPRDIRILASTCIA